jgi:hypothetical protein
MQMPGWLEILAIISLVTACVCSIVVILDLVSGHPQHMWIMNLVWPVTALYFGPLALLAYFSWGRLSTKEAVMQAKRAGAEDPAKKKPFWQKCAIGASHCGSGCTLGDIVAEWVLFASPLFLFGHKIFGTWLIDYVLAFATSYPVNWWLIRKGVKEAM